MRQNFEAVATIAKTHLWLQICADLGLYSPMHISNEPRKFHSGGRRENRKQLREPKEGAYFQTKRGYLVNTKDTFTKAA